MSQCIIEVAVFRPIHQTYFYEMDSNDYLEPGYQVEVPFGKGIALGVVLKKNITASTQYPIKKIRKILSAQISIDIQILKLAQWISDYYCAPIGEVLKLAAIDFHARGPKKTPQMIYQPATITLTKEQQDALQAFDNLRQQSTSHIGVLQGVTGSGKTEVYIELIKKTLQEGKSALILMPEIALTATLHDRFLNALLTPVLLWHSGISSAQRFATYQKIRTQDSCVVLGARSAIFAPLKNLGLIIVDEEHDTSYKQHDHVCYHARDVAIVRARLENCFILLGSATLSFETMHRIKQKRYYEKKLTQRISEHGLPKIQIIDLMQNAVLPELQSPFTAITYEKIHTVLAKNQQVIIFLNRRGFAKLLVCPGCKQAVKCINCSISLTVYKKNNLLRCHICNFQKPPSLHCEICGSILRQIGFGTEGLHEDCQKLFPEAKILRLDRDQVTTTKQLNEVIHSFQSEQANILVGTQMLVKGHHFPKVTLVVVLLADNILYFPDFRAQEKALSIFKQISGRSGRAKDPGEVLIQTFSATHPILEVLEQKRSEEDFIQTELDLRHFLQYPPFGRMARLRFEHKQKKIAFDQAHFTYSYLEKHLPKEKLQLLGPSEPFLEKAKGSYRFDIILKSLSIEWVHKGLHIAKNIPHQRPFYIDVDPQSF